MIIFPHILFSTCNFVYRGTGYPPGYMQTQILMADNLGGLSLTYQSFKWNENDAKDIHKKCCDLDLDLVSDCFVGI